jgi:hypothetical protein
MSTKIISKLNFFKNLFKPHRPAAAILEIVLALAIFVLMISSLVTLSAGSFSALMKGNEQIVGQSLAEQGAEAVRSIRDNAWNNLIYNSSGIYQTSSGWALKGEGTTDSVGSYAREITFVDICRDASDNITTCPGLYTDIHAQQADVSVSWPSLNGRINTASSTALLTDWDSSTWTQTDWSGGSGQSVWSDTSKYFSDDDNINAASPSGQIILKTAAVSGLLISSAYNLGTSSALQTLEWDEIIPICTPACSVKVQVRVAPDNSGSPGAWTEWYGPTGGGTYFTDHNGALIPAALNYYQWAQYQVWLTGDGVNSPTLAEIRIGYK